MKIIIACLFLSLPGLTFGQTGKCYKGTINHKIKVTFYLEGLNEVFINGKHALCS